jgi:hypothetical protein
MDRERPEPVVFEAILATAGEHRAVASEELVALVVDQLTGDEDERSALEDLVNQALDEMLEDDPALVMLPADLVIHLPTMLEGSVLTHRLTAAEDLDDAIETGVDLSVLLCFEDGMRLAGGGEVEVETDGRGAGLLRGPPGWLEPFEAGTLLAFRCASEVLSVEPVAEPAPSARQTIDSARAAYDIEVAEPWLPVAAPDIVAGMLLREPLVFSEPTVPLSELLAEAGLEGRGVEFAHDESVWKMANSVARFHQLFDELDEPELRRDAATVLDVFDSDEPESADLRRALLILQDYRIISAVTNVLLALDDDEEQLARAASFAESLRAAARRPSETAPAWWLQAITSERGGDPVTGQAQLEMAVKADPVFLPAVDRLAWYLSDRGDALAAARLWRSLGVREEDSDDLRTLAPFCAGSPVKLGRNEPCWCGSGRKFKQCHLGQPERFELPDRVDWLCRKTIAYLERRGGRTGEDVIDLAVVRADGDSSVEGISRALSDPIVTDVALHEGGWFGRFLKERGALLPDDEAILASAWALVDRTLYEVVDTVPGSAVTVRDLRSAELLRVRERTFSRHAAKGQVFCGRAVPDGASHQFVGGLFGVATGEEEALLNLLDTRDGAALLAWVAAKERPPRLTTREGEDLRICHLELEIPDAEAAEEILDRFYEAQDEGYWTEHAELANGESILRVTVQLDGNRINIETLSEPRAERALTVLLANIEGAVVVSDERREFDPGDKPPGPPQPALDLDDPAVREAVRSFIASRELAWCDEEIPALRGLTPRQAADDPAGREALDRLLLEYGAHIGPEEDPELVAQHPDRLRRLLDIQ